MKHHIKLFRSAGVIALASLSLVSCKDIHIPTAVSDVLTNAGAACGDFELTFSYRNEYPIEDPSLAYHTVRKFYDVKASYGGSGNFKNASMVLSPRHTGSEVLIALSDEGEALGIPWVRQTQPITNSSFTIGGLRTSSVTDWGSGFAPTNIGTLAFDTIETNGSTAPVSPETLKMAYSASSPKPLTFCDTTPIALENSVDSKDYYIPTFRLEPIVFTSPEFNGWRFEQKSQDPWLNALVNIPTSAPMGYDVDVVFDDPSITYRRVIKFIDQNNWNGTEYVGDIETDILSFATTNYVSDPDDWATNGVVYSTDGVRVDFNGMAIPGYLPGHTVAVFDYVMSNGGQTRFSDVLFFQP